MVKNFLSDEKTIDVMEFVLLSERKHDMRDNYLRPQAQCNFSPLKNKMNRKKIDWVQIIMPMSIN